jgi:hypothetical protein
VLCTPLLRANVAAACFRTFMEWVRTDERGAPVLELNFVNGDGPFQQLLVQHAYTHECLSFVEESFTRALLRPRNDGDAYLAAALSTGARKEYRRQRKRLGELGRLESVTLASNGDGEAWLEDFLRLEAAGWKGREHSALASNRVERAFFLQAARAALARGKLMMLALVLDGRPIAMKCNFLSSRGSFAFKIGYDENFASYSPGVQLELDNIQQVHRQQIQWMDSCAVPDHSMINRLWMDRRTIQTLLLSTGSFVGDALVSILPLCRWLRRRLRRERG